jgi:MFS family permease
MVSRSVLGAVMLVSGIAPLATDVYVPAFPAAQHDLSTSAALVQLTLTTFFLGMATGQLVGGPISDARGRRQPLVLALAVLTAASIACAFAPSIGFMLIARLAQGLCGGWAMVIARSIIVDSRRLRSCCSSHRQRPATPPLRRVPDHLRGIDGRHLRLRCNLGLHPRVDERCRADRVLR